MNRERTLAVIPARGGSKGIPRKNLAEVCGRPLLAWTIACAREAQSVGSVVVSTDDCDISRLAEREGASVVWRPPELATDDASSESALLHVLDVWRPEPELLVFLQCTSPLTLPADIDGTVRALAEQQADSALAVAPFHHFLWRADGTGINHDKRFRLPRQKSEPQYLETGAVYAMRATGFRAARHRFFGVTAVYVMPAARVLEIDEPDDLRRAELLLRAREQARRPRALPARPAALALDFDGVFTDNRVFVFEDGREAVACERGDGLGLARLRRLGLPMVVISGEANGVVEARCRKLGVECVSAVEDKPAALKAWLAGRGIAARDVVYLGNDVNDLACMQSVGCAVAVADAHHEVRRVAHLVLTTRGGRGAIRELADMIEARIKENRDGPNR